MSGVNIIGLATQKLDWLATRQSVVSRNIANVNTPEYQAQDVASFEKLLNETGPQLDVTNLKHMQLSDSERAEARVENIRSGERTHSGNGVSLENEMMKLGSIHSQYAFGSSVLKSFNRMIQMSLKG